MSNEVDLAARLAEAQRKGTHPLDPAFFATVDRPAAYRIQDAVQSTLGYGTGMLKTAVHPDGVGAVAPIYAPRVGKAPGFALPAANAVGVEVEVGVVLSRDVTSRADVANAIDHYFLGVEICGSRFTDRNKGTLFANFADHMSALGYCIGPVWSLRDAVNGLRVTVEFGGKQVYAAPAKHAFGTVLASVEAYADAQHPSWPLKAGTVITTGSLCGLVPTSGTGNVVARLGDTSVNFAIV
jgi:2-keto-4-pentenoate hydratase